MTKKSEKVEEGAPFLSDGAESPFEGAEVGEDHAAPTEQTVTMTLDQLNAMLDARVDKAVRERMAAVQPAPQRQIIEPDSSWGQTRNRANYLYDEFTVPDDDYLEPHEAVIFYARRHAHVVLPDYRKGKKSYPPIYRENGIVFQLNHKFTKGKGRENERFIVSSYECRSRMEAEWLRGHTEYGSVFTERFSSAVSADLIEATNLYNQMAALKQMSKPQLIDMAAQEGVKVGMNLSPTEIAAAIATRRAKTAAKEGRRDIDERAKVAMLEAKDPAHVKPPFTS